MSGYRIQDSVPQGLIFSLTLAKDFFPIESGKSSFIVHGDIPINIYR
jgi:hypothetical protein